MYFKENWQSMAEKDPPIGRIDNFQTGPSRQIEVAFTSAREKTPASLEKKCQKKVATEDGKLEYKYSDFRNNIMDAAGVRIVTYLLDDVKEVEKVIWELFDVEKEHSEDKLELLGADKVGYLSVHYIVALKNDKIRAGEEIYRGLKCEVQIRTVLEDAWAQIFHDRQYKTELQTVDLDKLPRPRLKIGNMPSGKGFFRQAKPI